MKLKVRKKISAVCSQAELGRRIGKRSQTINGWFKGKVPAELVLETSRLLNFAVTPHELRPDLYPNPTDALPKKEQVSTDDD
ncbi:transcriptional regulator [Serratia aquatilis]|uniref:Transcriptional regulator n=1 Tax=Serratia aquatilis TaxID=1737515 RepID=A0ABV6E9G5_9GAMM